MKNLALLIFFILVACFNTPVESSFKVSENIEQDHKNSGWQSLFFEIEILYSDFGLFNPPGSDKPLFQPSLKVPLKENQEYGWIIILNTTTQEIKWREELVLPIAPKVWGGFDEQTKHTISPDKKVCITEKEVVPEKGLISNVWSIAPDDPRGRYMIKIFIEDTLISTFDFDVN